MKQFRKNSKEEFICEECGKTYIRINDLGKHINKHHTSSKIYFDKWIKEETDGICSCGNSTEFWSLPKGYKKSCSKECITKLIKQKKFQNHGDENYTNRVKAKQTCIEIYGVKNPLENQEIRKKIENTKKEKYGNEYFNNYEKGKKTKIERYGKDFSNRKKANDTCLERYGCKFTFEVEEIQEKSKQSYIERFNVENPFQSEEIKDKIKQGYIEKYGVEYPAQVKEIHEKQQKNSFYSRKYKHTNINYRSSYEFDFLEKYYNEFSDIVNGPTLRYKYNNKNKIYYPDFYIPSLNLIIEIKNSYLLEKDKDKLILKEKTVKDNGFQYIMIVNKDYYQFEKYNRIVLSPCCSNSTS